MLSLNLLSSAKKEELKFKKIYLILRNFLIILLIFTVFLSIIMSASNLIIANIFNETAVDTSLVNVTGKIFKHDAAEMNELIKNIKKVQDNFINYDELLIELTKLIPKNIELTHLSVDTAANKIFLRGAALTRADLLILQKNLENSEFLTNIELPIANLLEKKNINFNLSACLKL
ncbi:MAG: PilN domain-containing protein [bacterium]